MDGDFVKNCVQEVKSQGVFDEFRMDSLADVDTKPAYQNVRNRVEAATSDFLKKQFWTADTNKLQLREKLRKHLLENDAFTKGVGQVVDQVVIPKVATLFEPKVESIVCNRMGITPPPPPAHVPPPRPPLLPAPPLPPYAGHMNGGSMLKVETTASLLPTDLEQISPDSDRATVKSDFKEDSKEADLPPGVDGPFDDDTSPSFEPLSEEKRNTEDMKEETNNGSLNTSDSVKELAHDSRDAGASQASQLSQVSSDSRLTIASTESAVDAQQPTSNSAELTPNISANISEEAQMPKFNENSSDTSGGGDNITGRQLHFDIMKDAITFEGTERKNSITDTNANGTLELSIEDAIMSEVKANISDANNAVIGPNLEEKPEPKIEPPLTPQPGDCAFDSFQYAAQSSQNPVDPPKLEKAGNELVPGPEAIKEEMAKIPPSTNNDVKEEVTMGTDPIALKDEVFKSAESIASPASSTSQHNKKPSNDKDRRHHSDDKYRRRSRERDREHSRDKVHSKHHSSSSTSKHSSHSSSSKHKSSKYDKSSSTSSSRSSGGAHESSSTKRTVSTSSSRHDSSSHKKLKSSSSSSRSKSKSHGHSHSQGRSQNGSLSSSSKRGERDHHKSSSSSTITNTTAPIQDDHNEPKTKLQKRRSHDSNDEGKPPGAASNKSSPSALTKTKETTENPNSSTDANGNTNGNHTNGNSNGTVDVTEAAAATAATVTTLTTGNVVVVSDMLQKSSTSFIELSSGVQAGKKVEIKDPNVEEKSLNADPLPTGLEEPKATELAETVAGSAISATPPRGVEECNSKESKGSKELAPMVTDNKQIDGDNITHFEENGDEFKSRLAIIEQLIEHRRRIVNVLGAHELPNALESRTLYRSSSKRCLSRNASEEPTSSDTPADGNSSSSSNVSNASTLDSQMAIGSVSNPSKRSRLDETKTSPTPSEMSVNSKENEAFEKHENDDISKRLSGAALSKLCQQQRYNNDDLYKPRPVLSQRSRRRGLDSIL